ncbi:MAG: hypothetical protein ACRD4Y_14585, partial [Candidatus Acidiferrales bacterium]
FNFAALFWIFRKRYGRLGTRGLLRALARMAVCAVAMAAACLVLIRYSHFAAATRFISQAAWLAAMILIPAGIYFALARILRSEELAEMLHLLRRREPRVSPAPGA